MMTFSWCFFFKHGGRGEDLNTIFFAGVWGRFFGWT